MDQPIGLSGFAIGFTIFLILTAICTIFGNGLVMITWIFDKSVRSPQNAYLVSLAFVDFLVGIFLIPMLTSNVIHQKWPFGHFLCRTYLLCAVGFSTVSILHLIAIAVDRYRATIDGLSYVMKRTYRSVLEKVLLMWIYAIWMALPLVLDGDHVSKYLDKGICTAKKDPSWTMHLLVGNYYIPLAVMSRLYYKLFLEIQQRLKDKTLKVAKSETSTDPDRNPKSSDDTELSEQVEDTEKTEINRTTKLFATIVKFVKPSSRCSIDLEVANSTSPKPVQTQVEKFVEKKLKFSVSKERRAAKTLGIIIGAFAISWLPFVLLYSVIGFLPETARPSPKFIPILLALGYSNSAMNPLIYSKCNREFSLAFAKILLFWRK